MSTKKLLSTTLHTNAWHVKLQKWTIEDRKPFLFALCPYNWITVFCILIIPYTLIKKMYIKLITPLIKKYKENKVLKFKKYVESLSDLEICTAEFNKRNYNLKKIGKYKVHSVYTLWFEIKLKTTNYDYNKINELYYELTKDLIKSKDSVSNIIEEKMDNIKSKPWWIIAIKYTKLFVYTIVGLLISTIIILLINTIVGYWNGPLILVSLKQTILGLLCIGIVAGIIYLLYLGISKYLDYTEFKYLSIVFNFIGRFFVSIYTGIAVFVGMFYTTLCPEIIWKDKDGNLVGFDENGNEFIIENKDDSSK